LILIFGSPILKENPTMTSFLITCCHATCAIPEAQRELFKGEEDRVTSPEGWEPGALNLAQGLAMKLSTPLVHGDVTRLLIDLEQIGDAQWSDISINIPEATRNRFADRHNEKFHHAIDLKLEEDFKRYDTIIHLDIHTAPIADGKVIFEFTGDSSAEKFTTLAAKNMTIPEIACSEQAMKTASPMIESILQKDVPGKIGIVRITASQSFFLKSQPLRWETAKKAIIQAVAAAATAINTSPPKNLQFDF
jgi:hypothetical protein